jgi:hypothetical protein
MCLLYLIFLIGPRGFLALAYVATRWLAAYPLWALVLGWLMAPTATLCYAVVNHFFGGRWTTGALVCMSVAILFDLCGFLAVRTRRVLR